MQLSDAIDDCIRFLWHKRTQKDTFVAKRWLWTRAMDAVTARKLVIGNFLSNAPIIQFAFLKVYDTIQCFLLLKNKYQIISLRNLESCNHAWKLRSWSGPWSEAIWIPWALGLQLSNMLLSPHQLRITPIITQKSPTGFGRKGSKW
jgi:hypothetical protein